MKSRPKLPLPELAQPCSPHALPTRRRPRLLSTTSLLILEVKAIFGPFNTDSSSGCTVSLKALSAYIGYGQRHFGGEGDMSGLRQVVTARHADQQPTVLRINLYFLPKAVNMGFQRMRSCTRTITPDVVQ